MASKVKSKQDPKAMRSGFTTGACATAAAAAACRALVTGESQAEVTIRLPVDKAGRWVSFAIHTCTFGDGWVCCSVIKDAGDDPDVTHGAELTATVSWQDQPGIELAAGAGVGTVTRPGLGLEVGGPAINPVPRKLLNEHVTRELGADRLARRGVRVEISVPAGEEMAKKTLNARLGILGGISILGTTGIVTPYSTAAYRASIAQGFDVALAQGTDHLVVTTGGRTERYAMQHLRDLPEVAFIEMGEFLGFALMCARRRKQRVRRLTVVGMIGKLIKTAAGHVNLHAYASTFDSNFAAQVAAEIGVPAERVAQIRAANTARHVQEILTPTGWVGAYCQRLTEYCAITCRRHVATDDFELAVMMTDFDRPDLLGRAEAPPLGAVGDLPADPPPGANPGGPGGVAPPTPQTPPPHPPQRGGGNG